MSMMPVPTSTHAPQPAPLDVTYLALVLDQTEPEIHAPGQLPGETLAETAARRAAAADITNEILTNEGWAA
ncbi:hypothetical protein [Nocardiopsis kunsanensis]|nr:hypothetical protein [Nocardiopsis kunsanensis]